MTALRSGAATDVGMVRTNNQDQLLVASPLFAVADGMGGHAAGEVASRVAVEALRAAFAGGCTQPSEPIELTPETLVTAVEQRVNRVPKDATVHFSGSGVTKVPSRSGIAVKAQLLQGYFVHGAEAW